MDPDLEMELVRLTVPEERSWRGEADAVSLQAEQEQTECQLATDRRGAESRQAINRLGTEGWWVYRGR